LIYGIHCILIGCYKYVCKAGHLTLSHDSHVSDDCGADGVDSQLLPMEEQIEGSQKKKKAEKDEGK
jgi:hypothetical protein